VQQPQQQQSLHTSLLLLQRGGQRLNQHARRRGPGSSVSVSVFAKQAAVAPPAAVETTGPKEQYDCVVVGGGISGLCTAQALATRYLIT
jgi:oxygen-dependent protoporphyrinogen oxidase